MPRGVYTRTKECNLAHTGNKSPGSGVYIRTSECNRINSVSKKGRKHKPHTQETKDKIGKANIGRKHSHTQETKDKMSESHIGHVVIQETKDKISKANTGKKHTQEAKDKIREAKLRHVITQKTKDKMSKSHLEQWKDPRYRKSQLKAIFDGLDTYPNECEKFIAKLLDKLFPNKFEFVGDGKFWVCNHRYTPDFVDKKNKLIIEHYGDLWHANKEHCDSKGITEVRGVPVEVIRRANKQRLVVMNTDRFGES